MRERVAAWALALVLCACSGQPPGGGDGGGPGGGDGGGVGDGGACVDKDGDGVTTCAGDCDDNDATRAPGKPEVCDSKDNDCNNQVDDNPSCGCVPGSPPKPCGKNNTCLQGCDSTGKPLACLPPGVATIDIQTDAKNCGECGNACADPLNATAACGGAVCGRGPCRAGFFDIDGSRTFGCESTCVNRVCQDPLGNRVTVSNNPLPETGLVNFAFASGSSFGTREQVGGGKKSLGILGESTPPAVGGAVEVKNAQYRHFGGFTAELR